MRYLICGLFGYLLGAIPFGYLAGCLAGVDIRQFGSGNIGATNVLRTLGRKFGYPVFLADTLKGYLAVRTAFWLFAGNSAAAYLPGIVAAVCVVLGHSFPVWLRFRGGKGVAASAGACFGLLPTETLLVAAIWIGAFLLFRFVSLASVAAASALPVSVWILSSGQWRSRGPLLAFTVLLAAIVIMRHRSNLARLLRGTEPRFDRK